MSFRVVLSLWQTSRVILLKSELGLPFMSVHDVKDCKQSEASLQGNHISLPFATVRVQRVDLTYCLPPPFSKPLHFHTELEKATKIV